MTIYEELRNIAKLSKLEDVAVMPPLNVEQEHMQWLARAVSSVTKEEFDELSPQAQQWFDDAAEALNTEGGTVVLPPGFGDPPAKPRLVLSRPQRSAAPPPPAPEPPSPPVQAAPPPAPAPKLTSRPFPAPKAPAAVPVQAAPPPPPPPEPEPEPQPEPEPVQLEQAGNGVKKQRRKRTAPPMPKVEGQSMTQRIRQYVLEDETLTVEDIIERLQQETNVELTSERRTTVATLRYDILRTLVMAKQAGWQPPTHH